MKKHSPPAQSSTAALEKYVECGFHIEAGVFDHAFCDSLVDVANQFPAVQAGDFRTVLQPHRKHTVFFDALRHPSVTRILRLFIGPEVSAIQTQFFYGQPGTPGFQPHQDNRFVNAPRRSFASVWIALTDVMPENGGLVIYPGSQREPLLDVHEVHYEETRLQDANALRLRCEIPAQYEPIDLRLKKGGAVFFDGHTIHASHSNKSNTNRYALLMTYVRSGVSFTPGRYAQREAIPIDPAGG